MKFDSYGPKLCIFLLYLNNKKIFSGEEICIATVLPLENDLVIIFGLWFSVTTRTGTRCNKSANLQRCFFSQKRNRRGFTAIFAGLNFLRNPDRILIRDVKTTQALIVMYNE